MGKIDFDEFNSNYDELMRSQHRMFGNIEYYAKYKVDILKDLMKNHKITNILEYGCGTGRNLPYIKSSFPSSKVYGFDISAKSLEFAKKRDSSFIIIESIEELRKFSNFFDVIFVAGVYHHIPPHERDDVTLTISNLVKIDGKVLLFEHNPYNPITKRMVNTCDFDRDAVLLTLKKTIRLFENCRFKRISSGYALFFPPRLAGLSFLEKYMRWIPLGGGNTMPYLKNLMGSNFIRYIIIGVINTLFGFGLIFILIYLGLVAEISNLIGYAISFLLSFYLNKKFNFQSRGNTKKELLKFISAMLIAYVANLIVMSTTYRLCGLNVYISQIAGGVVYVLCGFSLSKAWVFKG